MAVDTPSSAPVVAIVVAAGAGSRLGGETPKALREVGGVSLVSRSIAQLAAGGVEVALVVVAPDSEDAFEVALAEAPIPCGIVVGGAERQDSVARGVELIGWHVEMEHAEIVLVHDAARAFVPAEVVARVIAALRAGADAVVPVVALVDSIRELRDDTSRVIDRADLRAVQTPQGFQIAALKQAHELLAESGVSVTDDAAAAEHAGYAVTLVDGDRLAFKVTEPLDLAVAEALLSGGGA